MGNCCHATHSDETTTINCPACAVKGTSVELQTVKALLVEAALARLQPVSHRFCRTAPCPVVYYDETGASYRGSDVRARIWQKEPYGDRLVCYCFGESEATIREELERRGRSDAVRRVRAHIEADRCACDVRNPRGVCCLGDLTLAVKRVSGAAGTAGEAR